MELVQDYTNEPNSGTFGNISFKHALDLLELIEKYVNADSSQMTDTNDILLRLGNLSQNPQQLEQFKMDPDAILERVKIKIPQVVKQIEPNRIVDFLKQHLISENEFIASVTDGTIQPDMIQLKIIEYDEIIQRISLILSEFDKNIGYLKKESKKDFSNIVPVIVNCSEQISSAMFKCSINRKIDDNKILTDEYNEILRQLNEIKTNPSKKDEFIKNYDDEQKKLRGILDRFHIDSPTKFKNIFSSIDQNIDVIRYFSRIQNSSDRKMTKLNLVSDLYEYLKPFEQKFKKTQTLPMIIDIINYGRTNEYSKQTKQQFIEEFLRYTKNKLNTYKSNIYMNYT